MYSHAAIDTVIARGARAREIFLLLLCLDSESRDFLSIPKAAWVHGLLHAAAVGTCMFNQGCMHAYTSSI